MSVQIRPKAAEPWESRPGKSRLTMPQGDHTFATFDCKHGEKQPFADETASLTAPDRVCPGENRHGPPVGEGRFPALCVPEIQGGLFLDSGMSRLKYGSQPKLWDGFHRRIISTVLSIDPDSHPVRRRSRFYPAGAPCHCLFCSPSSAHVSPPRDQLGDAGPPPGCGAVKHQWALSRSSSGWH